MAELPRMEDWKDLRFGMFIHWGLYSLLSRGEWVMYNEAIPEEEYRKLADRFTAEKFDAGKWARIAKDAGMKYMVLTTRHHDGFSLWDSPGSIRSFTSMNTPARKDFVREFAEACRAEGLKVGFYYSPLDWRCPGFFFPEMYRKSALEMRQQTHDQIKELMTEYGKVDILWFDGGTDEWLGWARDFNKVEVPPADPEKPLHVGFWGGRELMEKIREWQPGIVMNNRFGENNSGDFVTPEQYIGNFDTEQPWESCMTLTGTWGYIPGRDPHSLRWIIRSLVMAATGDGNMLLNVGPKADGEIEPAEIRRLQEVGEWLAEYGEAIYGTRGGPLPNSAQEGMTYKDNVLYLHVWEWNKEAAFLPKADGKVLKISCLTADDFTCEQTSDGWKLSVGKKDRRAEDTIFKVEWDRPVRDLCFERKE